MDNDDLEYEISRLSRWGDFETFEDIKGIFQAMLERIRALENSEPSEMRMCGIPVRVLDTGNDSEVLFIQNGKVVGGIMLGEGSGK